MKQTSQQRLQNLTFGGAAGLMAAVGLIVMLVSGCNSPNVSQNPDVNSFKLDPNSTIKNWISWEQHEQSMACEVLAKQVSDPEIPDVEMAAFLASTFAKSQQADQTLHDAAELAGQLCKDELFAEYQGNGSTTTKHFVVGDRRQFTPRSQYFPFTWEANAEIAVSIYNKDGSVRSFNIIKSPAGRRAIFLDPGEYYLNIVADNETNWEIRIYRNEKQYEKLNPDKPRLQTMRTILDGQKLGKRENPAIVGESARA